MTLGLILIGLFGYLIIMKLFERSMLHFVLSEAYLNAIDVLMAGEHGTFSRVRSLNFSTSKMQKADRE